MKMNTKTFNVLNVSVAFEYSVDAHRLPIVPNGAHAQCTYDTTNQDAFKAYMQHACEIRY